MSQKVKLRRAKGTGAKAKRGLNRVMLNASLAQIADCLEYKASLAGIPYIKVNPAYTSQRCHQCGHTAPENRESQAVFRCTQCGHTDNADTNAARNILADALLQWGQDNGLAGSKGETDPQTGPTSGLAAPAKPSPGRQNRKPPAPALAAT